MVKYMSYQTIPNVFALADSTSNPWRQFISLSELRAPAFGVSLEIEYGKG
jgi:hypothetical protein